MKLPQCGKHTVIQNSAVDIGIEFTMNLDQESYSLPGETHQTIIPPPLKFSVATMHSGKRQMPDPDPAIQTGEGKP